MREARNGKEVVELINSFTGIEIEIINGEREAEIIFNRHLENNISYKKNFLFIDVGGGSTELTIFSKGLKIASRSFQLGTIRLIHNKARKINYSGIKKWLNLNLADLKNVTAIGTGGNINKLYKISGKKTNKLLSVEMLKFLDAYLNKFTYEERIEILGLNPDRADAIVQASEIYLTILKAASIKKILVPKIGLSDGIIQSLCEEP